MYSGALKLVNLLQFPALLQTGSPIKQIQSMTRLDDGNDGKFLVQQSKAGSDHGTATTDEIRFLYWNATFSGRQT